MTSPDSRKALTRAQLARTIDHTLLRADATNAEVERLCDEALEHGFFSVCVQALHVARSAKRLAESSSIVCAVVGFPLAGCGTAAKLVEADFALASGARELDMVIPIGALKSGDDALVLADVAAVAERCHASGAELKVILELCLLTEAEKRRGAELALRAGADCLKTSTGFSSGGATVADVRLLRELAGPEPGVKAAGGISTAEFALELLGAGATRLGCSRSVALLDDFGRRES